MNEIIKYLYSIGIKSIKFNQGLDENLIEFEFGGESIKFHYKSGMTIEDVDKEIKNCHIENLIYNLKFHEGMVESIKNQLKDND